jgi:hypothetical protein
MGSTTELRRALKSQFFPLLAARGFVIDKRHGPGFVDFRRSTGSGIQILQFQWEKYGKPRFRLSFCVVGSEGTIASGHCVAPEDVGPGQAPRYASLYPTGNGSSLRHWFCQDAPLWARLLGKGPRRASRVVDELSALFPEAEEYLRSGKLGPHCQESVNPAFRNATAAERSGATRLA